jgi:hypothetical protein
MKLAPLLSQYLMTQKQLALAGIGVFNLDAALQTGEDDRPQRNGKNENISFKYDPSVKIDEGLVNYISAQTGKMKTLASADLESFLEVTNQFLHIGKPFLLEGIGTLSKNNAGELNFTANNQPVEKHREMAVREMEATSSNEESFKGYNEMLSGSQKDGWKKAIVFLLLISGIALAIWGGYALYKYSKGDSLAENIDAQKEILPVEDTTHLQEAIINPVTDSSMINSVTADAGTYKFILEQAGKRRANERYDQLKSYFWKVQLETADSITYKIFMRLPVHASDTLKVKDSLSVLTGRKVWIEK